MSDNATWVWDKPGFDHTTAGIEVGLISSDSPDVTAGPEYAFTSKSPWLVTVDLYILAELSQLDQSIRVYTSLAAAQAGAAGHSAIHPGPSQSDPTADPQDFTLTDATPAPNLDAYHVATRPTGDAISNVLWAVYKVTAATVQTADLCEEITTAYQAETGDGLALEDVDSDQIQCGKPGRTHGPLHISTEVSWSGMGTSAVEEFTNVYEVETQIRVSRLDSKENAYKACRRLQAACYSILFDEGQTGFSSHRIEPADQAMPEPHEDNPLLMIAFVRGLAHFPGERIR